MRTTDMGHMSHNAQSVIWMRTTTTGRRTTTTTTGGDITQADAGGIE